MALVELFAGQITEEIRALARARILEGGNLATRRDLSKQTKILVLLLVLETHPHLFFARAEERLIYGVSHNKPIDRNSPHRVNT